jgi:hypothetical protein
VRAEGGVERGLPLLGLCAFAVLQPLLDLLAREPGFLVARKATAGEILLLVGVLGLVLPGLLWGGVRVAAAVSQRLGHGLQLALVAGLALLVALPIIKRLPAVVAPLDLVLAVAVGAAVAAVYERLEVFRSFLSLLALAPLIFAGLFLTAEGISPLVFAQDEAALELPAVDSRTPVVMVIFDELSLTSLLASETEIDAVRYPSFARLAGHSHWFRNASAVDWRTLQVIPALLTGRYPTMKRRLPIASQHPHNLFALLSKHYRMNVVETHTQLHESRTQAGASLTVRARSLFADLWLVYLHVVLPQRYTERLPEISKTWKDFGGLDSVSPSRLEGDRDRPAAFRRFVQSIDARDASFHFLHIMLPHSPWEYLPSGERYSPHRIYGNAFEQWLDEEWWVIEAHQRHLLQLAFVDGLLGELMAHLESIDLYDDVLLVVTADHGVSFWPDGALRAFGAAPHPEDVLSVPLFIKEPHQRRGTVHMRNVESIDVLPAIAEVLGIDLAWEIDGCSALDPRCPERPHKLAFTTAEFRSPQNKTLTYPADIGLEQVSLHRKLALFGSGTPLEGPPRFGAYAGLVGRRALELVDRPEPVGSITLERDSRSDAGRTLPARVPARVLGVLHVSPDAGDPPHVAVVVNGVIHSVVPAPTDGKNGLRALTGQPPNAERIVSAMIPDPALRGAGDELDLYLVTGPEDAPQLGLLAQLDRGIE